MKILIYSHTFAPRLGGVETIVMALARGLSGPPARQSGEPMEVTVATPAAEGNFDDASLYFRVVRQPGLWHLLRLLRTADVIHLAGPALLPLLLAVLLRRAVVVEHHGFQAICPNGQLVYEPDQSPCPGHFMAGRHRECLRCNAREGRFASFKLWLLTFPRRCLCRLASANIAPTHWTESLLQLPRASTIHHGLPAPRDPGPVEALRSPATFAFHGRLVSTKGAHLLLKAAALLKARELSFQILFIGDGPERARLKSLAASLQLNDCVQFLGSLPQDALDRELSRAAAIVMPSLGGEVFGLVALENMLRGRLLIVSDLGALTEVVGDSAFVFAVNDAAGLARCMVRVLEDPANCMERAQRVRKRAEELFGHEKMIREHLSVYESIL